MEGVEKLNPDGTFSNEGIRYIMDGLIRTGIAMSYVGNSRPASGSEHHLSHYWEAMFLFAGKEALLHGTKVGLTSILIAKIYEWFAKETKFDFARAEARIRAFDEEHWEAQIRKLYLKAAPGIIAKAKQDCRNDVPKRLQRLAFIEKNLPKIQAIAASAKSYDFIEGIMRRAGAPLRPMEVGISDEIVYHSVCIAHEVRQRYTILNLLHDLDLSEQYAKRVVDFLQA